ncbi:hypothetical protein [Vibrio sp. MA40-2]|uniref:hypothetical protein n=1 Tax=Vibrio sp. MA40-2 TaxID=3391828 RepID=UPI0039A63472
MINLTHHSVKRCQQRGIDPAVVELLVAIGIEVNEDNEASKLAFSKREKKRLLKTLKKCTRTVEKTPYVVLSYGGDVITTAHQYN